MQATHTLVVTRRDRIGSRYAKRERAEGRLPCVLYGQGKDPAHLTLAAKEAIRFFESGERVFEIELESEGKTQTVLLKDLQFDYLGTNVVHCDLMRVNLQDEVESHVPIRLVGETKAAEAAGAVLVQKLTELTITCTVANLPDHVDVDISQLTADDPVTADKVRLPEGVIRVTDPETIVAIITIKAEETDEDEAAGPIADDVAPDVAREG